MSPNINGATAAPRPPNRTTNCIDFQALTSDTPEDHCWYKYRGLLRGWSGGRGVRGQGGEWLKCWRRQKRGPSAQAATVSLVRQFVALD